MGLLHAMFKALSTPRVTTRRLVAFQCGMAVHESANRLAEALQALDPAATIDPTYIAGRLNESPQVITNWRKRGVSKDGAISAQETLGVSCTWVLYGLEPKLLGQSQPARLTGSIIRSAFRDARTLAMQGGAEADDFNPAENDDDAGILAVAVNRMLAPAPRKHDSVIVEVGHGSDRRTGAVGGGPDKAEAGGESHTKARKSREHAA